VSKPYHSRIVVTGTDTGVGKSIITAALVQQLHLREIRAAGIKPVETGCAYSEDHNLIASDGALLHSISPWVPANTVAPFRFVPPVAPAVAARRSGLSLRLEDLVDVVEQARHYADLLVIEGAGGALSPLTESKNTLDLASTLSAPILIAAKDALGTQSHTLAVIEAARHRKVHILGVILTRFEPGSVVEAQNNAETIRERGKIRVFDHLPHIDGDQAAQVSAVGRRLTEIGLTQTVVDLRAAN
jgi:dethiobiotin synthetase